MNKLIKELQERGVLRVAGLYVALSWLLLQMAEITFPAFEIPESYIRYILYAALAGLPVVLLTSWFFEVTPEGILTEDEVREHGSQRSGNQALTGITITALALALGISVFVNVQQASEETLPAGEPSLVSILVADFDNTTGDPLFDGSLEPALTIGLEGAAFISSYARNNALRVAEQITEDASLDEEAARLVSVREGIDLVLLGSINQTSDGYRLTQTVLDPMAGEMVAEAVATADDKAEVLPAVGALAAQIREALGDVSLKDGTLAASETFTAASLAAVQYYTQAQTHAFREENLEAIEFFEKAVDEDPEFGRAYTGWALSEMKLGRREKSEELWEKALELIGGTTERERYRTLGLYYTVVTANPEKAIENYELLVEKYPADGIGWNNLGVAYFYNLQFDKAMEVGAQLAEMSPENPAFRANYALFAMYAGNFDLASSEAEALLLKEPGYFLAYLPQAMANIYAAQFAAAEESYSKMGEQGQRAASTAATGMADLAKLRGDYATAAEILEAAMEADLEFDNSHGAAYKGVYLARALAAAGDAESAITVLDDSIEGNTAISHLVPAALLLIDIGETERAAAIQKQLGSRLQKGHRAAAGFLKGAIALGADDYATAIAAFNGSLEHNDSWLTRFYLGKAQALAGNHQEALAELRLCEQRIGETTALYLDDIPTAQYSAPLYYWIGRTEQQLGNVDQATRYLERYVSLRIDEDTSPDAEDARDRLATLTTSLQQAAL